MSTQRTLTIHIDTTRFVKAMKAAAQALARFAAAMQRVNRATTRAAAIRTHGPRNLNADGTWQTDLCAAWVHDACPATQHCNCTCHGGPLT